MKSTPKLIRLFKSQEEINMLKRNIKKSLISLSVMLCMTTMIGSAVYAESSKDNVSVIKESTKASDVIKIKDPQLELLVRANLGQKEGAILRKDAEALTIISNQVTIYGQYNSKGIESLDGLENFKNLTELSIDNYGEKGNISNLSPIKGLVKLKYLSLSNQKISDTKDLRKLTQLNSLNLGYNNIVDISGVKNMTLLKDLTLWNNKIKDISAVSNLKNLYWLMLENNQIKNISAVSKLTNLESLCLNTNKITDIRPIANLTKLQNLCVFGNNFDENSGVAAKILSDFKARGGYLHGAGSW